MSNGSVLIGKAEGHQATLGWRPNHDLEITCECGAVWTHKASETPEQVQSIYLSHLKYFNRPKMETL